MKGRMRGTDEHVLESLDDTGGPFVSPHSL